MAMQWTEQLSIGNEILDSDHKELIELARCIECSINALEHSALARDFKLLKMCMNRHFLNEELFADNLNIPFAEHDLEHKNILTAVDLIRREIGKNSEENVFTMESCNQFLQNWLIKHLNESDLLMKPILQTRPYTFKVEGVFAERT